jgi:hypothetical protein
MIDFPVGLGIGLPFKHEQNFFSVSDQDPDWIRIQSGQWIRIWIREPDPDPNSERQK